MKLASFCKRDEAQIRAVGRPPHSAHLRFFSRRRLGSCTPGPPVFAASFTSVKGSLFSCPALALFVALWPIQPVAELLQLETEGPFAADANRRPYAKTPRTPAFGMADLEVPWKDVLGDGCLSLLHILY
jgi:hypothetical protein